MYNPLEFVSNIAKDSLEWNLINHYRSGLGTVFYVDEYRKITNAVNKVSLNSLPVVLFSTNVVHGRLEEFEYHYYAAKNHINDILENPDIYSNFDTLLDAIYKECIKKERTAHGKNSLFPVNIGYATAGVVTGYYNNYLRGAYGLGDFTVYIWGSLTINRDGSWNFNGWKNMYDYWDFDWHGNWKLTNPGGAGRDIFTAVSGTLLGATSVNESSFVVKLKKDMVYNTSGKI